MANKKRIEERLEAERQARQTRYIQIAGAGVIILLIALAVWQFLPRQECDIRRGNQNPQPRL